MACLRHLTRHAQPCKNKRKQTQTTTLEEKQSLSATQNWLARKCKRGMASSELKKRRSSESADTETKPVKKGFWNLGLQQAMKDETKRVFADDRVVIINDQYPKARLHWLVLPWEEIKNLSDLGPHHVPLVKYMMSKAQELVEESGETANCRLGFHAAPSMSQLHLHVISQDFVSPCLKTKKHWNSFTSSFFVDAEEIVTQLKNNKSVRLLSADQVKRLMDQPLRCHKCKETFSNMPKLKTHLLTHV